MGEKSLKGFLLVSDIDGTLITEDGEIPRRNVSAIERFTREGGLFALATGRSESSAERYVTKAAVNAPSIICNGTTIFDYQSKSILWSTYLPAKSTEILGEIIERFPDVGIELFCDAQVLVLNSNELVGKHVEYEKLEVVRTKLKDAPANCNKMLFAAENARLHEVEAFLEQRAHDGVEYVFSSLRYYEALPTGITKGSTVKVLADLLHIEHSRIMGIGDYYNDLALVEAAAIGAVPENAPEELKFAANVVVCSCAQGAVADFIEYIEQRFGR
jgi:Cof subfamily protein (haloacid dehalogenase superfamily)